MVNVEFEDGMDDDLMDCTSPSKYMHDINIGALEPTTSLKSIRKTSYSQLASSANFSEQLDGLRSSKIKERNDALELLVNFFHNFQEQCKDFTFSGQGSQAVEPSVPQRISFEDDHAIVNKKLRIDNRSISFDQIGELFLIIKALLEAETASFYDLPKKPAGLPDPSSLSYRKTARFVKDCLYCCQNSLTLTESNLNILVNDIFRLLELMIQFFEDYYNPLLKNPFSHEYMKFIHWLLSSSVCLGASLEGRQWKKLFTALIKNTSNANSLRILSTLDDFTVDAAVVLESFNLEFTSSDRSLTLEDSNVILILIELIKLTPYNVEHFIRLYLLYVLQFLAKYPHDNGQIHCQLLDSIIQSLEKLNLVDEDFVQGYYLKLSGYVLRYLWPTRNSACFFQVLTFMNNLFQYAIWTEEALSYILDSILIPLVGTDEDLLWKEITKPKTYTRVSSLDNSMNFQIFCSLVTNILLFLQKKNHPECDHVDWINRALSILMQTSHTTGISRSIEEVSIQGIILSIIYQTEVSTKVKSIFESFFSIQHVYSLLERTADLHILKAGCLVLAQYLSKHTIMNSKYTDLNASSLSKMTFDDLFLFVLRKFSNDISLAPSLSSLLLQILKSNTLSEDKTIGKYSWTSSLFQTLSSLYIQAFHSKQEVLYDKNVISFVKYVLTSIVAPQILEYRALGAYNSFRKSGSTYYTQIFSQKFVLMEDLLFILEFLEIPKVILLDFFNGLSQTIVKEQSLNGYQFALFINLFLLSDSDILESISSSIHRKENPSRFLHIMNNFLFLSYLNRYTHIHSAVLLGQFNIPYLLKPQQFLENLLEAFENNLENYKIDYCSLKTSNVSSIMMDSLKGSTIRLQLRLLLQCISPENILKVTDQTLLAFLKDLRLFLMQDIFSKLEDKPWLIYLILGVDLQCPFINVNNEKDNILSTLRLFVQNLLKHSADSVNRFFSRFDYPCAMSMVSIRYLHLMPSTAPMCKLYLEKGKFSVWHPLIRQFLISKDYKINYSLDIFLSKNNVDFPLPNYLHYSRRDVIAYVSFLSETLQPIQMTLRASLLQVLLATLTSNPSSKDDYTSFWVVFSQIVFLSSDSNFQKSSYLYYKFIQGFYNFQGFLPTAFMRLQVGLCIYLIYNHDNLSFKSIGNLLADVFDKFPFALCIESEENILPGCKANDAPLPFGSRIPTQFNWSILIEAWLPVLLLLHPKIEAITLLLEKVNGLLRSSPKDEPKTALSEVIERCFVQIVAQALILYFSNIEKGSFLIDKGNLSSYYFEVLLSKYSNANDRTKVSSSGLFTHLADTLLAVPKTILTQGNFDVVFVKQLPRILSHILYWGLSIDTSARKFDNNLVKYMIKPASISTLKHLAINVLDFKFGISGNFFVLPNKENIELMDNSILRNGNNDHKIPKSTISSLSLFGSSVNRTSTVLFQFLSLLFSSCSNTCLPQIFPILSCLLSVLGLLEPNHETFTVITPNEFFPSGKAVEWRSLVHLACCQVAFQLRKFCQVIILPDTIVDIYVPNVLMGFEWIATMLFDTSSKEKLNLLAEVQFLPFLRRIMLNYFLDCLLSLLLNSTDKISKDFSSIQLDSIYHYIKLFRGSQEISFKEKVVLNLLNNQSIPKASTIPIASKYPAIESYYLEGDKGNQIYRSYEYFGNNISLESFLKLNPFESSFGTGTYHSFSYAFLLALTTADSFWMPRLYTFGRKFIEDILQGDRIDERYFSEPSTNIHLDVMQTLQLWFRASNSSKSASSLHLSIDYTVAAGVTELESSAGISFVKWAWNMFCQLRTTRGIQSDFFDGLFDLFSNHYIEGNQCLSDNLIISSQTASILIPAMLFRLLVENVLLVDLRSFLDDSCFTLRKEDNLLEEEGDRKLSILVFIIRALTSSGQSSIIQQQENKKISSNSDALNEKSSISKSLALSSSSSLLKFYKSLPSTFLIRLANLCSLQNTQLTKKSSNMHQILSASALFYYNILYCHQDVNPFSAGYFSLKLSDTEENLIKNLKYIFAPVSSFLDISIDGTSDVPLKTRLSMWDLAIISNQNSIASPVEKSLYKDQLSLTDQSILPSQAKHKLLQDLNSDSLMSVSLNSDWLILPITIIQVENLVAKSTCMQIEKRMIDSFQPNFKKRISKDARSDSWASVEQQILYLKKLRVTRLNQNYSSLRSVLQLSERIRTAHFNDDEKIENLSKPCIQNESCSPLLSLAVSLEQYKAIYDSVSKPDIFGDHSKLSNGMQPITGGNGLRELAVGKLQEALQFYLSIPETGCLPYKNDSALKNAEHDILIIVYFFLGSWNNTLQLEGASHIEERYWQPMQFYMSSNVKSPSWISCEDYCHIYSTLASFYDKHLSNYLVSEELRLWYELLQKRTLEIQQTNSLIQILEEKLTNPPEKRKMSSASRQQQLSYLIKQRDQLTALKDADAYSLQSAMLQANLHLRKAFEFHLHVLLAAFQDPIRRDFRESMSGSLCSSAFRLITLWFKHHKVKELSELLREKVLGYKDGCKGYSLSEFIYKFPFHALLPLVHQMVARLEHLPVHSSSESHIQNRHTTHKYNHKVDADTISSSICLPIVSQHIFQETLQEIVLSLLSIYPQQVGYPLLYLKLGQISSNPNIPRHGYLNRLPKAVVTSSVNCSSNPNRKNSSSHNSSNGTQNRASAAVHILERAGNISDKLRETLNAMETLAIGYCELAIYDPFHTGNLSNTKNGIQQANDPTEALLPEFVPPPTAAGIGISSTALKKPYPIPDSFLLLSALNQKNVNLLKNLNVITTINQNCSFNVDSMQPFVFEFEKGKVFNEILNFDKSSHLTLVSFSTTFHLVGGLNLPKIISCLASNGQTYRQLVKYRDDLRQDAIMGNLMRVIQQNAWPKKKSNSFLSATASRSDSSISIAPLHLRSYTVVPLMPFVGVLEYVADTQPLGDLLSESHEHLALEQKKNEKSWKEKNSCLNFPTSAPTSAKLCNKEISKISAPIATESSMQVSFLTPNEARNKMKASIDSGMYSSSEKNSDTLHAGTSSLKNAYLDICAHFPPVMRKLFYAPISNPQFLSNLFPSSERNPKLTLSSPSAHLSTSSVLGPLLVYHRYVIFTRSLASISMTGYILGLGDRHPQNYLLDRNTFELILIDLNLIFDQGKLLRIPERVPFRLTPDFIDGISFCGNIQSYKEKPRPQQKESQISSASIKDMAKDLFCGTSKSTLTSNRSKGNEDKLALVNPASISSFSSSENSIVPMEYLRGSDFWRACVCALGWLRENKDLLLTLVDIVRWDPLYKWTIPCEPSSTHSNIISKGDRQVSPIQGSAKKEGEVTKSKSSKIQTEHHNYKKSTFPSTTTLTQYLMEHPESLQTLSNYPHQGGPTSGIPVNNSRNQSSTSHHPTNPNQKLPKNQKTSTGDVNINAELPAGQGLPTLEEPDHETPCSSTERIPPEAERAILRVKEKLTGLEGNASTVLSVSGQVLYLLSLSINVDLLSQMYYGWQAWM